MVVGEVMVSEVVVVGEVLEGVAEYNKTEIGK